MIMRSFENQIRDSINTMEITAQRQFHLVKCQMFSMYTFKNSLSISYYLKIHFIILKSIIFIFINSISIYKSSFKAFVGILMILNWDL